MKVKPFAEREDRDKGICTLEDFSLCEECVKTLMKAFFLVKQEPSAYSWDIFEKDKVTAWTGVRNFQARNVLRSMKKGDEVLFYHSVTGKCVVGIARVDKTAYPDPTAKEGDWVCVDLCCMRRLKNPVSLEKIKLHPELQQIPLLRQSRLSVMPLSPCEFETIVKLGS